MGSVGGAAAVEPQGPGHARRRLRRRLFAGRRAARRLRRDDPGGPDGRAELHRRAGPGLRGDVDRARQQRPQLQHRRAGGVADDGEGAPRRAVRRDPLHRRHRLLGRLARAAAGGERLPRHLPGAAHHLRLSRHVQRGRAVRRLPHAAHLLRGSDEVGARRRVVADADGRRRGASLAPECDRRRRAPVQGRHESRGHLRRGESRLQLGYESGRRALRNPRLPDEHPRAAPAGGLVAQRDAARPRLRRVVHRQRRDPVRPRGAAAAQDHAGAVRRPEQEHRRR